MLAGALAVRRPRNHRTVLASLTFATALAATLAACGSSDDGTTLSPATSPATSSPVTPSDDGSATSSPTDTDDGSSTSPTATACAPTDDGTPRGADTVEVIDVDGDGQRDTAWITPGADRRFGITTASGATFSTAIGSASPVRASAVVNRVGADELPVALVDTGRAVDLVLLTGCQVRHVKNEQGDPYTFDKGFTGYGTGVACLVDGDLTLAGMLAEPSKDGSRFKVTRTWVELSQDGTVATNGASKVIAKGAAADSDDVVLAQETSCDGLTAPPDGPVEPEG